MGSQISLKKIFNELVPSLITVTAFLLTYALYSIPKEVLPLIELTSNDDEIKQACPELNNIKLATIPFNNIARQVTKKRNMFYLPKQVIDIKDPNYKAILNELDDPESKTPFILSINSYGSNASGKEKILNGIKDRKSTTISYVANNNVALSGAFDIFISTDIAFLKEGSELKTHGARIIFNGNHYPANAFRTFSFFNHALKKENHKRRTEMQKNSGPDGRQISYKCASIFTSDGNFNVEILPQDAPKLSPKIHLLHPKTETMTIQDNSPLNTTPLPQGLHRH